MKRFIALLFALLLVSASWLMRLSYVEAAAGTGNLFVSDDDSGNIYEFTPNGTKSTFASGLKGPYGLAFDGNGNLFVADNYFNSGNLYEFTPSGVRSTFASGLSYQNYPGGLAIDGSGNLFMTAPSGNSYNIYEFTPSGTKSTFASGLIDPGGLAFDGSGNLFVADNYYDSFGIMFGKIDEFTPTGAQSTFASSPSPDVFYPESLAFDASGNLFVADGWFNLIYEFTPNGTQSSFASPVAVPGGLAFDSNGNLFESDFASDILEFTPNGTQSIFASGLHGPSGLAFAPTPEPSTLVLLAAGALALIGYQWRRRQRKTLSGQDATGSHILSFPTYSESKRTAA